MKSTTKDLFRLAWALLVIPGVLLLHWTSNRTLEIAAALAAGAVVPVLLTREARLSGSAILFSLIGTAVNWSLAESISPHAHCAVANACTALFVYGVTRGHYERKAMHVHRRAGPYVQVPPMQ